MNGVEPGAQIEPLPEILCPLVFLHGREMKLDPLSPQRPQFRQQAPVNVRVVAEPIVD